MKMNLILLASGNSTRFKGNKLLALVDNKPMYMNVIEKILKLNFNKVILVTQYEEIKTGLMKKHAFGWKGPGMERNMEPPV